MTDITPENRAFYRATTFLRGLYDAGLRHVVISPGSRSTPLVMAAASLPDLEKHVILDERSAAFFALGIGKATNRPAALICTSGTAVANYFPAVIEARMSGVPLLLLTADRPPHLQNTGANQTIDQQKIFGNYPVFFHDAGEPVTQQRDGNRLYKLGRQSIHYAKTRQGPVHLNFPFRKPLEPNRDFVQKMTEESSSRSPQPDVKFPANQIQKIRFQDDLLDDIHAAERPLIIVGQLAPGTELKRIFNLAEQLGAPMFSEQGITNPDYSIQGFEGFLRNKESVKELEPDLVFRFGRQPAGKSLLKAIPQWETGRHIHFSDTGQISDIAGTATDFIELNGRYFDANKFPEKSDRWLQKWKEKETKYFKKSARILDDTPTLTDGHVYHHLAPVIPDEWFVFISNSFPARDQSMFGRWSTQNIFTNRGASGIDGITSTAMGVATGLDQPGVLFTGDLAFLHDTNALLNANELKQPLVIVVINNRGGSIFRMLPIAKHSKYFERYFETPQNANIGKLAAANNINYTLVKTLNQLMNINLYDIHNSEIYIIECKTDPEASMKLRNKLWGER